jgi:D-lactate dehydrogenase
MRVAFFSIKKYEKEYFEKYNIDTKHELVFFEVSLDETTANLAAGFHAICVFVNDKINKPTLKILHKLGVKLIDLRSAGYNNVDLEAAAEFNITVLRVPAYSPHAVAEHAVAIILTLNRKTHKVYNRVRENNFSLDGLMGFNLHGKTVGVMGTGKIGMAFCNIMLGFGCKIIAYDLIESEELKTKGITYTTFDKLLAESDIISLHCPLNPQTKHRFNSLAFAKLKKGTMLINTSRGGLIKTAHAIEALKSGSLGSLGIDVYEQEENIFFKDMSNELIEDDIIERLMAFHNVLVTPHQGFFTHEAMEQITIITLKNFSDFEKSSINENEVVFQK